MGSGLERGRVEPTCQPWSIPVSSTFVRRPAFLYGKACPCTNLTAKPGEIYYFLVHMVAGGGYNELTPTQQIRTKERN